MNSSGDDILSFKPDIMNMNFVAGGSDLNAEFSSTMSLGAQNDLLLAKNNSIFVPKKSRVNILSWLIKCFIWI